MCPESPCPDNPGNWVTRTYRQIASRKHEHRSLQLRLSIRGGPTRRLRSGSGHPVSVLRDSVRAEDFRNRQPRLEIEPTALATRKSNVYPGRPRHQRIGPKLHREDDLEPLRRGLKFPQS